MEGLSAEMAESTVRPNTTLHKSMISASAIDADLNVHLPPQSKIVNKFIETHPYIVKLYLDALRNPDLMNALFPSP